ncbi:hypothetical protein A361_16445 [Cytobacillus oceanisediminis 2691]|uniref:Uncharacterized protein n=1 Tax=Cytobacillus oceanisediminis 2691 TaxID=1196031 RepID=A0A160MCK9_9BACI|nr:hypothetical protein A361_16445 [Cytobacillus oceanisediminis 2691]
MTPAGGEGAGDPAGEAEELCSSPRKASVRSGNQRTKFIYKTTIRKRPFSKTKSPLSRFSKTGGNAAHK